MAFLDCDEELVFEEQSQYLKVHDVKLRVNSSL